MSCTGTNGSHFHRPEALADPLNGHIPHFVTPLAKLGVLDLLAGDANLTQEVTAICTPGHTDGHMSVIVSSAGKRAMITGDVIGHPHDVTEPDWLRHPAFEHDSVVASQTRRAVLDRIEAEGMTIAAGHMPEPGFGRIVRLEGRRWWQPLWPLRGVPHGATWCWHRPQSSQILTDEKSGSHEAYGP